MTRVHIDVRTRRGRVNRRRPAVDEDAMSSVAAPEGYALVKVLRDSARSRVLLALRESDGREVVLEAYHSDRNRSGSACHVQRELDAMRSAAGPGEPEALDLLLGESPPLLVLERVPGVALSHWIRDGIPELEAVLAVALRLLETLGASIPAG